jgi:hypothetical protein
MKSKREAGERGSALVISLLALLVLTMVGTLFMAQTKTETQIAGNDQRHTQALYNAEAGSAEVLARMSNVDLAEYIGQPTGPVSPGWGRYIVLANGSAAGDPEYTETETDGLDNDGDAQVDEDGERFPEVMTVQTDDAINYPWVKVRYKLDATGQPILFGDHDNNITTAPQANLASGIPVIVVTASGAQGAAARTVEVEAVKYPFETTDSAMYLETDDVKFNGTSFLISGGDWDPDTGLEIPGNPDVPGILTTGDPNEIVNELNGNQANNVEGEGAEPSVGPSPIDLDLPTMAAQYSAMADISMGGGTYSNVNWGSATEYNIVHVDGDLHTSGGGVGGGLLIVDGDFDCTGQFTWYGIVLVLGDIRFSGGGAGIHIYGTVLGNGFEEQTVGGQADIFYSSIAIERLTMELSPYIVASWEEI